MNTNTAPNLSAAVRRGRIAIDMSPSLDGYIAGRNVEVAHPFGDAGHRLHRWLGFEGAEPTDDDRRAAARMFEGVGAIVLGRRMFDVGTGLWGEDGAFGLPCFVVTHRPEPVLVRGPTTFTFINDGVIAAVRAALASAAGQDVVMAGGADIARQALDASLVDELWLHVAPVVLGGGAALFGGALHRSEWSAYEAMATPHATHVRLRATTSE
jgi:dihydrofolate reductase